MTTASSSGASPTTTRLAPAAVRRMGRTAVGLAAVAALGTGALLVPGASASETTTVVTSASGATAATSAYVTSQTTKAKLGTIVYIKKGNVWIARGDGPRARQVTKNGTNGHPYRSPSESDRGIIAVSKGTRIVRMSQRGRVLNRVNPPTLVNSVGAPMNGTPFDVAISPNGKTIAWSYVGSSCPIAADCMVRSTTGYTAASRYKEGREAGLLP